MTTSAAVQKTPKGFWGSPWTLPGLVALVVGCAVMLTRCPGMMPTASDFELPTITSQGTAGTPFHLSDQKGKVVLVDFFATWCGPCQRSTPALVRLHHRFSARGLVVLGVDEDDNPSEVVPMYVSRHNVPYSIVVDTTNVARKYGVSGFPTLFLIGRDGKIRYTHAGQIDEDEVAEQIDKAL